MLITQSDYGYVSAVTDPGASCYARAIMPTGQDAGGIANPHTSAADGTVSWLYPKPPAADGTGTHYVSCSNGSLKGLASATFIVGA